MKHHAQLDVIVGKILEETNVMHRYMDGAPADLGTVPSPIKRERIHMLPLLKLEDKIWTALFLLCVLFVVAVLLVVMVMRLSTDTTPAKEKPMTTPSRTPHADTSARSAASFYFPPWA
jgi:hypothetical protein